MAASQSKAALCMQPFKWALALWEIFMLKNSIFTFLGNAEVRWLSLKICSEEHEGCLNAKSVHGWESFFPVPSIGV